MEVNVSPVDEREEWIRLRKGKKGIAIGASAAAQAVGFSRYSEREGPMELFNKILYDTSTSNNKRMKRTSSSSSGYGDNSNSFYKCNYQAPIETGSKRKRENSYQCKNFGIQNEHRAVQIYSNFTGWETAEGRLFYANPKALHAKWCGFIKGDEARFEATLDARVYPYGIKEHSDKWFGMEVKCPFGDMYPNGQIHTNYMAQMQMQMAIVGMQFTDFTVVKFDRHAPGTPPISAIFKRVYFCLEYWEWLLPQLRNFSYCLETKYPPQIQSTAVPYFPNMRVVNLLDYSKSEGFVLNIDENIPVEPEEGLFKLKAEKNYLEYTI